MRRLILAVTILSGLALGYYYPPLDASRLYVYPYWATNPRADETHYPWRGYFALFGEDSIAGSLRIFNREATGKAIMLRLVGGTADTTRIDSLGVWTNGDVWGKTIHYTTLDPPASGGVTSIAESIGIKCTPNPIITTGKVAVDTTTLKAVFGTPNDSATWAGTAHKALNSDSLGGYAAGAYPRLAAANTFSASPQTFDTIDFKKLRGGLTPVNTGYYAMVGGGESDTASDTCATVAGGNANKASGIYSTVGGGKTNKATNIYATASGGRGNLASGAYSVNTGGRENTASGSYAVTVGGYGGSATGSGAITMGGTSPTSSGPNAVVLGGYCARAVGIYAISSGYADSAGTTATDTCAATLGGYGNAVAGGRYSVVSGGKSNRITANYGSITGGTLGRVSGVGGVVAGGQSDTAAGVASFAGGIGSAANDTVGYAFGDGAKAAKRQAVFHSATTNAYDLRPDKLTVTSGPSMFAVMDSTAMAAITPAEGMMVYCTTWHTIGLYNGTKWMKVDLTDPAP